MSLRTSTLSLLVVISLVLVALPGCRRRVALEGKQWTEGRVRYQRIVEPVFHSHAVVRETGPANGDVVLLVHGVGKAASKDWDKVVPGLNKTFRVVVVDLPGYGLSGKGNKLYSPDNYARFLSFLVSKIASGPVFVVGHSMGGAICLKFAAMFPAQVRKLVLADAAGVLHREAFANHMVHQKTDGWKLGSLQLGGMVGRSLEPLIRLGAKLPVGPHKLLQSKSGRVATLGGDPMKISAFALMLDNFGAALDKLQTRTLLIWGALDPVAPVRTGLMIASRVPSARLYTIAGAHHVPMKERPAVFNRLLLDFFGGSDGAWPAPSTGSAAHLPGAVTFAEAPLSEVEPSAARVHHCKKESGQVFSGSYKEIRLDQCDDAVLSNVSVGRLVVLRSRVRLRNITIGAPGVATAIKATHSRLHFTVGSVFGDVGMLLRSTRLDLGAVRFVADNAVVVQGGSEVIASVCTTERSDGSQRAHMHGFWRLGVGKTLPHADFPNN